MVADIARVSYDHDRYYRSMIIQQGRVTLESDNNEATVLQAEALRLETIDIIGPAGTPDKGYVVSGGSGPGGVTVGRGIYYLGGWRLELDRPIDLAKQPDWVDAPEFNIEKGNLVVALLATEQSVGATEDQALREVALGGPDSAARTRLMQRFLRIPTEGATCPAGAKSVAALLEADGVTIDAYSLQLMSSARLRAGFVLGPKQTDPCQPTAAGGYLGADNQLVRVTVTAYDPTRRTGKLLWGWNNASLLYRAEMASPSDPLTLKLTPDPVDQEHAPRQAQMVEVSRTTTSLGDNNFIADDEGFVVAVAQSWSPDTGEIVLHDPLPTAYQNNTDPLFVRLWQAEVDFEVGKPTALDATSGINVTITMDALPRNIAARPFWHFAVRPAMPQAIFPQRYHDKSQPPDGPRQWITDLAIVTAHAKSSTRIADCRIPFLPLTEQPGGCCGRTMGPDDVSGAGGLQEVIDSFVGGPAVLSLRPGTYTLSTPLNVTSDHVGLTIEGCTDNVIIKAGGSDLTVFRNGLIVFDAVRDVTLRRLTIDIPFVVLEGTAVTEIGTLVGLTVLSGRKITIDSCTFDSQTTSVYAFGAEMLVVGPTAGVTLTGNTFGQRKIGPELFGVLAMLFTDRANTEVDHWIIDGNSFDKLLFGVLCYAQLGLIRCEENVVTDSAGGFHFAEANLGDVVSFTREALIRDKDMAMEKITAGRAAYAALRPDVLAKWSDRIAPIIKALPSSGGPTVSEIAHTALAAQMKEAGVALIDRFAATARADSPAPAAAPAHVTEIDTTAFEKLSAISIAAELQEVKLTPALRIANNEITLTAGSTPPIVGIGVALSPSEPGSVIVSGNRVVVPDGTIVGCGLLGVASAVVTGNLMAQLLPTPEKSTPVPCLILYSFSPAIMVSANMVSFWEFIWPPRNSQAVTTTWEFLDTTG